ncbi:EtfA11: electron transfer flavoprotein, subunit alpha [Desulfosarcina variabilis str. Montpellier]|uniref:electron transfer flavoprotein subunit alpha/FixB family protein n=1 Tax=Desulfosarcina variabilis TaxID=2300 RepID=UPI003AFAEBED
MSELLILGEVKDASLDSRTLELLGAGKKLTDVSGDKLSVLLMGDGIGDLADEATGYGPDTVYKLENPLLKGFNPDLWLAALEQACAEIKPTKLIISHSFIGMELAPRLACRLGSRLTTDCIDLSIDPDDEGLLATKPVSGGNAMCVFKCKGATQMVTVRGNVFEPAEAGSTGGAIIPINVTIDESMSRLESLEIVAEDTIALDKANVVIAGGAGLGDEDGFEMLEELAEALGKSFGSVMIGCSRMAVDKGWISSDHQIGLTGTIIAPDIYVAVGISGAIHHLVGMVHSKKIIAINTDPSCNIFKVADYGIVEDFEQVVPALVKKLEEVL